MHLLKRSWQVIGQERRGFYQVVYVIYFHNRRVLFLHIPRETKFLKNYLYDVSTWLFEILDINLLMFSKKKCTPFVGPMWVMEHFNFTPPAHPQNNPQQPGLLSPAEHTAIASESDSSSQPPLALVSSLFFEITSAFLLLRHLFCLFGSWW